MAKKSLLKNVIYNFIYTGLNFLYPLITAPYISRVLGASNLGKVNFATAIVNWFILFAVFGTTTYGVRQVAKSRDNKEELNKVFSEIFIINATLSIIVTIIYVICIVSIDQFYTEMPLYLILSLSIILNMFSIDWFFQGIEEYKYIMIRSAILKVISLICLFLFVSGPENYIIYGLISVLTTSLGGILNYTYSRKFIKVTFRNTNPFRHFKFLKIFFFHAFIVNIYTNLDQVFLGFFIDTKAVAFMNRTKVIIAMAISVSTAISNATLPRASYYIQNDKKKFLHLVSIVPNYILWITIPIAIGVISLAPEIMFILGGSEFLDATLLLQIVALTIIFAPLSTYLQYQVLVASGKEKLGLYVAILTSITSLVLNVILIPLLGFIGAGLVQVCSEFLAVTIRYYIAKRHLGYTEIEFINVSSSKFIFSSLLMAISIILIRYLIENEYVVSILSLIVGLFIYIFVLYFLKDKITLLMMVKFKQKVMKKIYKNI